MSHHASGPNFGFPRGDARLDMTDLYAFPKPGDPGKSILILNVHPSIRLDSPEPTTTEPFAPGALYEIKIDINDDAIADICYSVQFASSEHGQQTATVRRIQGARAAGFGDFRFFFGWRSDPFFLDVIGNFNHMQFTGDDFFIDKDVCSIVIELPNSDLGSNELGDLGSHGGQNWGRLGPGRPRCKTIASGFPRGRRAGGIPHRGASE